MDTKKKRKKNQKKKKNNSNVFVNVNDDSHFTLMEVLVIVLLSVVFGGIIGYSLTYGNSNLSKVRTHTYLGEFVSTYSAIVDNYYKDVDEKKLTEYAIKGMISSLEDPYSVFLDEYSAQNFNESVDGKYVGVGITVTTQDHYHSILSIVDNSPAAKAGLQVGDIILFIDDIDCEDVSSEKIYQRMEGTVGSSLKIDVLRNSVKMSFVLKRDYIEIQSVTSKVIFENDKKIGYIKVDVFSSNTYDQFVEQLNQLEKKKIHSLIIDLRNNPGGHLLQAKKMLSLFFPKNVLLYQIEKNGRISNVYSLNAEQRKYPIVLLVNEETASSAEVVASCFQENYQDIHLIGTNTYGKGNVQKTISLSDGSSIKFTIETWLSSHGQRVDDVGITPDIIEEQSPTYYVDFSDESDSQLQMAISILK